jgi:hypothetical protein
MWFYVRVNCPKIERVPATNMIIKSRFDVRTEKLVTVMDDADRFIPKRRPQSLYCLLHVLGNRLILHPIDLSVCDVTRPIAPNYRVDSRALYAASPFNRHIEIGFNEEFQDRQRQFAEVLDDAAILVKVQLKIIGSMFQATSAAFAIVEFYCSDPRDIFHAPRF